MWLATDILAKRGHCMTVPQINDDELHFIQDAAEFLDNPGFAIRAMNTLGQPIEALQKRLPDSVRERLGDIVQKSLQAALGAAIKTVNQKDKGPADWNEALRSSKKSGWMHTAGVAVTGAVGGLFGLAAMPVELPLSTTMMLRGISDVASRWGMDLQDPEVQLQCLYVFTLGSNRSTLDDDRESGYLSSRVAFEQMMRSATRYMAKKSATEVLKALDSGAAPALIKVLSRIAKSFELTLTEKILAESVPLIGALGGASINALFCDYFAEAARYHFGLLYLEQKHGRESIEASFQTARRIKAAGGA